MTVHLSRLWSRASGKRPIAAIAIVAAVVLSAACLAWQGPVTQSPFVNTGQQLGNCQVYTETCADLDGDGAPDCVLASVALGGTVQVFMNKGGAVLRDTGQLLPIRPSDFYLWNFGIVLADVNGDGRFDLVTADAARYQRVHRRRHGAFPSGVPGPLGPQRPGNEGPRPGRFR